MFCGVINVLFAGAALLAPFRPGEVTVGGEVGHRTSVTLGKMLHHTDIEDTFTRHFRHRKAKPDELGGFIIGKIGGRDLPGLPQEKLSVLVLIA